MMRSTCFLAAAALSAIALLSPARSQGFLSTDDDERLGPFWGAWFGHQAVGGASAHIRRVVLVVNNASTFEIEGACSGDLIPLGAVGSGFIFKYEPKSGKCLAGKARISFTENPRDRYRRKFVKFELENADGMHPLLLVKPQPLSTPIRYLTVDYFNHFTYADDAAKSATGDQPESAKRTIANLADKGWKCLSSLSKEFKRSERVNFQFGTEEKPSRNSRAYVIGCTGQCEEISYTFESKVNNYVTHFGANYPVPVLLFDTGPLTGHEDFLNLRRFGPVDMDQRTEPAEETKVWVAELSNSPGDTGPGCGDELR
ncbi:hypothetical protein [Sinorhizobium meliloti]|uniref:hypothetical protein n=1 Tax=Rhizobium meliloti TaxID=382 RepID=UPI00036BED2F|nr:hypothetical protein [Sinorhizobium meliloti]